jgi:putative transposase
MARIARIVVPHVPHHVTQRGNRKQQTFFCDADYVMYRSLMRSACELYGVEVLAYCLMPNHVHLIAVPEHEDSLRRAMGDAHCRYTTAVNARNGWRGCLWQGRFFSFPMAEPHLIRAARYVELNPVRAGMCKAATDYRWSSARAHVDERDDELVSVTPLLLRVGNWQRFLQELDSPLALTAEAKAYGLHTTTGRPLGPETFVRDIEAATGRALRTKRPGPRPRQEHPRVSPEL